MLVCDDSHFRDLKLTDIGGGGQRGISWSPAALLSVFFWYGLSCLSWYSWKALFPSIGFPGILRLYQIEVLSRICHNLMKFRFGLTPPDFPKWNEKLKGKLSLALLLLFLFMLSFKDYFLSFNFILPPVIFSSYYSEACKW